MRWIGPYRIDQLLDDMLSDKFPKPPESESVYLVSLKPWETKPTSECDSLYVGGNTGRSPRFRTRIGDLVADVFGFFSNATGHHSGGQSINAFCRENKLNPKGLFIGWLEGCECARCAENELFERLDPKLNKNRPARCRSHRT